MTTAAATTSPRPPGVAARRLAGLAGGFALVAALGVAIAVAIAANEVPGWMVLLAGAGLLGTLALAVVRYEWAVALAFLLFAVVRVEPAPTDAVFAVVIAVAIVTGRMHLGTMPLGAAAACAAFVAFNLISCFQAVDPGRAASFVSITVYLLVFALWIPSWLTDRRHARRLVRIYVGAATLSAVIGSLALFVPLPGHDLLTAYTGTRARAFFKDPNVFGPFLVVAAILLAEELLQPRLLRSGRLLKAAALAVVVCGVLFSYSRAAWLNFAVSAIVMGAVLALRRGGAHRALLFVGVLAIAAVAVLASVRVTGSLSFLQERAHLQAYDNQRFGAQSGGIEIGERRPLGIGPGQFELVEPISAHSTYVRALAEEGVLGFLALVVLVSGTLLVALRNAVRGWDTHGIGSTVLLACWCGVLANSLFVDTLHWRHLWLLAGLIWAAGAAQASSRAGTRLLR